MILNFLAQTQVGAGSFPENDFSVLFAVLFPAFQSFSKMNFLLLNSIKLVKAGDDKGIDISCTTQKRRMSYDENYGYHLRIPFPEKQCLAQVLRQAAPADDQRFFVSRDPAD